MEMYNSEYYNGQSGEYYSSNTRGSGQLTIQVHQHQLVSPPDKQRHSYSGGSEMLKNGNNEQFVVEEFFDFSNENIDKDNNVVLSDSGEGVSDVGANNGHSMESSSITTVVGDVGNRNFTDGNDFSNDLCLPYDDLAEFLSNMEEESFSSEDLQKLQLISGLNARMDGHGTSYETRGMSQPNFNSSGTIFRPEVPVPGKARSKRTRAQPCKWTSRLLAVTPTSPQPESTLVQQVFSTTGKKTVKTPAAPSKNGAMDQSHWSTDGRKCLHCATDKTPQWRTGPMGPKTLCNACGVRYKSGRLVPEYRPAASPTFTLTKHSNSHRKVLELRRQKEMVVIPQHHHHRHNQQLQYLPRHGMMYDVPDDDERTRRDYRVPNF